MCVVVTYFQGNAFYIVGFLEFIYHEGLLDDAGEDSDNPNELKIDVERIRQNTMLVDTVADVLLKKIQRLSGAMQETLKIASMLGYRFDPELVAAVQLDLLHSRKPSEAISTEEDTETLKSVDTAFKKAIQNGFIERTGSGCQFCHDRFQSAFRSTVDSSEVQLIHKLIGEELLLREGGQERYRAALHLNRAVSLFVDEDIDLTRVARINLDASQYCQGKSFFFEAVKVLNTGLDILPEKWEKNYDLSLEMSTMLARMLLCVGDFAGCRRISHEITTRAKTLDDKLDLFTVFSDVCQAQSEFSEGVSFGIKTLNEMGIRVPVKVSIVFLISQLVRVNKMLRGKSDADIMGMPAMDDKLTITAMRILAVMGNAYLILRDDDQGVCCAMLALELCLKGGMSPYSDGAFASYAVMQMGLGKYDRALRFSDLSIKLWWAHKNANKVVNATPFIYATAFISHWNEPLAVVAEKLDTATKISFATGDVQPMLIQALWLRICAGENLNDLVDRFGSLHSRLDDLQQGGNIIWLLPAYQFVLNLSSAEVDTWRGLTELTGEVMNENDYAPRADDSADELLLGDIRRMFNFQLAYHFGYYSRAKSLFEESLPFSLKRPMTFHFHVVQIVFFFGALTYFELARVESSLIHRWQARRCKRNLDNLKIFGRPNLIPLLAILEAEEFASAGRKNLELLEERFENAINATASAGLVHMEALANERAGVAFGRLDQSRKANLYFQRASHLYLHSYGARNKAAWLDEQYQQYSESVDHLPGMDITIPSVDTVS
jgi:tetratricopeptide (TPR) repeat protein